MANCKLQTANYLRRCELGPLTTAAIESAQITTQPFQVGLGDGQWRHQHYDVAQRADDRAAPAGRERDLVADARVEREARPARCRT